MEKVVEGLASLTYYMPHHGIFKSENANLRVVFNTSSFTTSGQSLNDNLLAGEVKEDVFELII